MHLKDKVALITGAAKGLGQAYADILLQHGAKVAVADIQEDIGKNTVIEFESKYGKGRAIFIKCDVTKKEDREDAFRKTTDELGPLNLLINNAGVTAIQSPQQAFDINMFALIEMTYTAMNIMDKTKGGAGGIIINISSVLSILATSISAIYMATKHAVTGFTRAMVMIAREKPEMGLHIYNIAPGYVKTDLTKFLYENLQSYKESSPSMYTSITKSGGFMEPEFVAQAMISLVKEEPVDEEFLLVTNFGPRYIHLDDLIADICKTKK